MELAVMMLRLLEGLKVSAAIFAVTLVFSLPLGLFVSFLSLIHISEPTRP